MNGIGRGSSRRDVDLGKRQASVPHGRPVHRPNGKISYNSPLIVSRVIAKVITKYRVQIICQGDSHIRVSLSVGPHRRIVDQAIARGSSSLRGNEPKLVKIIELILSLV